MSFNLIPKDILKILVDHLDFKDKINLSYAVKHVRDFINKRYGLNIVPLSINPITKKQYFIFDYQIETIRWMMKREKEEIHGVRGGICGLAMGLGKTNTVITLSIIKYQRSQKPTLVITEKILMNEWKLNFEKFYPNIKVLYLHKDFMTENQMDNLREENIKKYLFIVTTYDFVNLNCNDDIRECAIERTNNGKIGKVILVDKPYKSKPKGKNILFTIQWERVVCDESQVFSNPKTNVFKSLMCICSKNRWCLTGTPIRNNDLDMFTQLCFLGYKDCVKKEWNPDKFFYHGLDACTFFMDYDQAGVSMPDKDEIEVGLELQGKEKEFYDYYSGSVKKIYASSNGSKYMSILSKLTRLRQICSVPSTILNDDDIGKYKEWLEMEEASTKCAKVNWVVENVKKIEGKVIIFSCFSKTLDVINLALSKENIKCFQIDGSVNGEERKQKLDTFKNGLKRRVLLMTFKTGSKGLNLTCANTIICFDKWWNSSDEEQAMHRAWRLGQEKKVMIYKLIIKNSIEDEMMKLIWDQKKETKENYKSETVSHTSGKAKEGKGGMTMKMMGKILGM